MDYGSQRVIESFHTVAPADTASDFGTISDDGDSSNGLASGGCGKFVSGVKVLSCSAPEPEVIKVINLTGDPEIIDLTSGNVYNHEYDMTDLD